MQIHTHYTIHRLDGGALARGMYSTSDAYETPELARTLGIQSMARSLAPTPLALTRVETQDAIDSRGEAYRRLVRETILEVVA